MLILGVLLAIGGCDKEEPPPDAPAEHSPATTETPRAAPAHDAGPPAAQHVVKEGETLWDIARAYEVSLTAIMQANEMAPGDVRRLRPGHTLRIIGARAPVEVETAADRAARREALPPPEDGAYHFVRPGDSLWTIARLYDAAVEALMERNGLSDEAAAQLKVGEPLVVPGLKPEDVESKGGEAEGIVHEMARGETIWDLAHAFKVGAGEIMAANGLSERSVTRLREGAKIFIPGVVRGRSGKLERRPSARQRRAARVAKQLGLGTRQVAGALLHGRVKPAWIRAAGSTARLPGTLRWPVTNGWFVRGFGSGEGGYHQAIDIMGKIGWNVRAAAPGIVAYAGNELRGYGNIVLVVHPGGWVTMYAHNSVNFVSAGERVPRGAILAEVGSTGISRGPHVHFALSFKGKSCDPAPLLRPGVRHRSGKLSPLDYVTWSRPARRPKQIRCEPRKRHPRSRWVVNE